MTRRQRYQYEMFARLRDFGMAHKELFPESSVAGLGFAKVIAAVAAIDEYLKNRVIARAEARRVKATTRETVFEAMKAIAHAARRATRAEPGASPFRVPRRRSIKAELSTARAFLVEAAKRQEQFAKLGLPATFVTDFQVQVDQLQRAVDIRTGSRALRKEAQAGIETVIRDGFEAILDLDVAVAAATRQDPIRLAAYRSARRIDGRRASATRSAGKPSTTDPVSAGPAPAEPATSSPAPADPESRMAS